MSEDWTPVSTKPAAPNPWADPHGTLASILGPGQITSAARSAARNAQADGSATSSHLTAQAVDWHPADGNTRQAAQKLAMSGVPYDQIIDEGTHVHVGYGPKMRRQTLTSQPVDDWTPVSTKPVAATGGADDWTPVSTKPVAATGGADDWTPVSTKPVAAKLKPNAVPVPPSLMDRFQKGVEGASSYMADNPVSNYVGQEIKSQVIKPFTDAGHAIAESYRNPGKDPGNFKIAGSIINIPMSLLNAVPHALVERPVAAAMTANPLPAYAAPKPTLKDGKLGMTAPRRMSRDEEQASNESAVTNALMALGPGEGGAHGIEAPESLREPVAEAPKPTADELLGPDPVEAASVDGWTPVSTKPVEPGMQEAGASHNRGVTIEAPEAATPPEPVAAPEPAPWSKSDLRGVSSQGRGFLDPHPGPLGRYADTMYRETNPETAAAMTPGTHINDSSAVPHYLSNDPDLALGQGDNRGVLLEYDAHKLDGIANMQKPGASFSLGNGSAEFQASHTSQRMAQTALKAVRVPDGAEVNPVLDRSLRTLESRGWVRSAGDGYTEWRKPSTESPRLVPPEPVAAPEPAPRQKTMAADVEHPDDVSLEGPEPTGGDVVGTEADPVERLDNALYRVAKRNDVAKVEGMKFLKDNEAIIGDQALQETLHHEIEKQLVDPEYKIGDDLDPATAARVREAEAVRAPWAEFQRDAINRRREMGDPDAAEYQPDRGYVPRYAEGHDPLLDAAAEGPTVGDPIMGGRNGGLSTRSESAKQRTAGYMVTDQNGNTHFTAEPDATDIMDRPYSSVRPATTAEIEANTDTRYNKNATVNTIRRALHDEAVVRHLEVLEELKEHLVKRGLAVQDYWYRKNEAGELVKQFPKRGMGDNGGPAMEGAGEKGVDTNKKNFRGIPEVPQLDGYRFAPHIAETLEDYYHRPTPGGVEDHINKVAAVNRLLTAPMFATPFIHGANVTSHWAIGRGFDHVTPGGMKSLLLDGGSALHQVLTLGPVYQELLQHGMGGQYIGTQTRGYHQTMLKAAGKMMDADPEMRAIFSKAAGVPWKAIKAWYNTSSKALWYINDVLLMQRVLELKRKGMSTREAIYETERDIPNYRIPPRVGGTKAGKTGRAASVVLQTSAIGMFNRYKYGAARALAAPIRDILGKVPLAKKAEAAGKLLVGIIAITGIMPALNWTAQKVTGNKNAKFRAPGGLSMVEAAKDVATGNKDPSMVSSTFFSPGPALQDVTAFVGNHDFFGRNIRTPGAPAWFQSAEFGKYMGTQGFYPGRLAEETATGHGDQALGQLLGLQLPTQKQADDKKKYAAEDAARARKVVENFKSKLAAGKVGEAVDKMGR